MATKNDSQPHENSRFTGYYIDDLHCSFCRYYLGRKFGCALTACSYVEETVDAIVHGRIHRKPGSMRWEK